MPKRRGAIIVELVVQGWFHEFTPIKRDKRKKYANPVLFESQDGEWRITYPKQKGGTGPFKSRKQAENWYNNGGR